MAEVTVEDSGRHHNAKRFNERAKLFVTLQNNTVIVKGRYRPADCFCCIHNSLRVSPAMAAGVADRLWSKEDVAEMVDAGLPKSGKRGPYKKRVEP